MSTNHNFGNVPSASLGTQMKIQLLESSLSKLFECLALECSCRKLVHPQWKHFKSMKLTWEDRIRLNNALWRCWHIQYLKGKRPKFCGYVTPMTGESHTHSRAVILEGKYWRRRLEAVANEYKNWRVFYKKRAKHSFIKTSSSSESIQANDPNSLASGGAAGRSVKLEAYDSTQQADADVALWNHVLDEHDTMQMISSYSDTLFSSLVQGHPSRIDDNGGFADVIQPRLNMVQHSLYDVMPLMGSFDVVAPSSLDSSEAMKSVMSGEMWQNPTPSPVMQQPRPTIPMQPLAMEQQQVHQPMDTSSSPMGPPSARSAAAAAAAAASSALSVGPSASGSSIASNVTDAAAMSDAHMAAQQLLLLMSSNKEVDSGTLKQLQMLLQSAATAPPVNPPQVATTSSLPPQQQQQPQQTQYTQQTQHISPMQPRPPRTMSPAAAPPPPLTPVQSLHATSPHISMATTAETSRSLDTFASQVSQLSGASLAAPSLLSSATPQPGSAFFGTSTAGSASYDVATAHQVPSPNSVADQAAGRSPLATSVKSEKPVPIVGKEERRKLHITAEQKRRVHIRNGFDELQSLVPSVSGQSTKISKAVLLQKSVEHMRHLQQEKKGGEEELDMLRAEVARLNESIMHCQDQLPVTGAPVTRTRLDHTQQLFDHYVNIRTQSNYKFWIFSMIVRSLFDAYNNSVSTMSEDEMCRSVLNWFDHHCSLRALRPAVLSSLRQLSTSTSILSDPSKLSTEAAAAAASTAGNSTATAVPSNSGSGAAATAAVAAATSQLTQPNAAATAAANAAAVAAMASTFQPNFQAQQQQQQQQLAHLGEAARQQRAQQQQQQAQQPSQLQQLNYFADGGLPFLNPAFK
ncbi:carbohydrate-responsive element-binding protein-like isoform X3 [Sycon ciliatum]|uniref:carbohydrate-responsive element-binding protein-like isoform X3 n=1 Tax=Sycon ciliatum TaxID=27933 RepID=UPI0031F71D90